VDGIRINKKFAPLWNSQANYFIITGGRGSGKSFAVSDFIENLTFEQGHTILFTRYTLTAANISIIPEFQEKIDLEDHGEHFKVNKTDIVNTATDSTILFRGIKTSSGNQTANLKSIQNTTTWVLDEAEELTDERIFDKIDESIRKAGIQNRIIILLNPCSKEHFIYKRFFESEGVEPGQNITKGNITYIHTTYLDNVENLSDKFINKAERLRKTNPKRYAHIMLGGWLEKAEGVIFNNWRYGPIDESIPFIYGMDFGFFPDPDALCRVAVDRKRKIIYVKQVLTLNNAGVDKLADEIKASADLSKTIIADSAEPRLINDLQSKGIKNVVPVKKYAGSVIEGIKVMQDYEIIVHPDSTGIGKELNNYAWSDKKNSVPIDAFNHWIDAIRYAVTTLINPIKRGKTKFIQR
jgi:phage terminase large subunit